MHNAHQIDRDHRPPVFQCHLVELTAHPDAGVVEDDIQPPVTLDCIVDQRLHASGIAVVSVIATKAGAMDLEAATADAWQEYLRGAGARMQARLDSNQPFLWVDEAADRGLRVRQGEVVVAPLVGHGTQTVPNGLVHDWIGAVFIPNSTIEGALGVVHDFDRYKEIYKPIVKDSRSLECRNGRSRVFDALATTRAVCQCRHAGPLPESRLRGEHASWIQRGARRQHPGN